MNRLLSCVTWTIVAVCALAFVPVFLGIGAIYLAIMLAILLV